MRCNAGYALSGLSLQTVRGIQFSYVFPQVVQNNPSSSTWIRARRLEWHSRSNNGNINRVQKTFISIYHQRIAKTDLVLSPLDHCHYPHFVADVITLTFGFFSHFTLSSPVPNCSVVSCFVFRTRSSKNTDLSMSPASCPTQSSTEYWVFIMLIVLI